jgi:hypothetical protein
MLILNIKELVWSNKVIFVAFDQHVGEKILRACEFELKAITELGGENIHLFQNPHGRVV